MTSTIEVLLLLAVITVGPSIVCYCIAVAFLGDVLWYWHSCSYCDGGRLRYCGHCDRGVTRKERA